MIVKVWTSIRLQLSTSVCTIFLGAVSDSLFRSSMQCGKLPLSLSSTAKQTLTLIPRDHGAHYAASSNLSPKSKTKRNAEEPLTKKTDMHADQP